MTGDKREQYWKLLKEREAELTNELGKRERIAIERAADAVDDMILAGERDAAILHLDREACLLREVREALNRLCDGTYGACLRCDRAIRTERLSAIPWAAYCIECQEAIDKKGGSNLAAPLKGARPATAVSGVLRRRLSDAA